MTAHGLRSVAARNTDRFTLRLPASGMLERLAKQARENKRAINSEIIAQLESVELLKQELERFRRLVDEGLSTQAIPEMNNVVQK